MWKHSEALYTGLLRISPTKGSIVQCVDTVGKQWLDSVTSDGSESATLHSLVGTKQVK